MTDRPLRVPLVDFGLFLKRFIGLRSDVAGQPLTVPLLLCAIAVCAVLALTGRRAAAVLLLPLSAAWLLFNGQFEGPVLLELSSVNGVTASDLIAVLALAVAAWSLRSRD